MIQNYAVHIDMPGIKPVLLCFFLLTSIEAFAGTAADVRNWYETQYAPHYADIESIDPDSLVRFYESVWRNHTDSGPSNLLTNSAEFWSGLKERLRSEGWIGSTLHSVDVSLLNSRTAEILTHWSNRYRTGNDSEEIVETCDWYLASEGEDGWKFTTYVALTCEK